MAYSSGRVWIEALRLDPLCLFSLPPFCEGGLRMAQVMSLLLIASGVLASGGSMDANGPCRTRRGW